jgi:hypothetical protein
MTEGFQVPLVAWQLGVHTLQIEAPPADIRNPGEAPGVVFQVKAQRSSHLLPVLHAWPATHYKLVAHTRTFRVFESDACKVAL